MAAVTICSDFGAQKNKSLTLFPLFPHLFPMKWWDRIPWSSFSDVELYANFFTLHFHFHQEAFEFLFTFCLASKNQSCVHCWIFQICWHIEWSTFTASSFRIWNHSTGIPSPPLALFVVILPKAHLTSHSRVCSRWVITPSWLSGSWRSFFVQFFCVFLPPLLNILCFF